MNAKLSVMRHGDKWEQIEKIARKLHWNLQGIMPSEVSMLNRCEDVGEITEILEDLVGVRKKCGVTVRHLEVVK